MNVDMSTQPWVKGTREVEKSFIIPGLILYTAETLATCYEIGPRSIHNRFLDKIRELLGSETNELYSKFFTVCLKSFEDNSDYRFKDEIWDDPNMMQFIYNAKYSLEYLVDRELSKFIEQLRAVFSGFTVSIELQLESGSVLRLVKDETVQLRISEKGHSVVLYYWEKEQYRGNTEKFFHCVDPEQRIVCSEGMSIKDLKEHHCRSGVHKLYTKEKNRVNKPGFFRKLFRKRTRKHTGKFSGNFPYEGPLTACSPSKMRKCVLCEQSMENEVKLSCKCYLCLDCYLAEHSLKKCLNFHGKLDKKDIISMQLATLQRDVNCTTYWCCRRAWFFCGCQGTIQFMCGAHYISHQQQLKELTPGANTSVYIPSISHVAFFNEAKTHLARMYNELMSKVKNSADSLITNNPESSLSAFGVLTKELTLRFLKLNEALSRLISIESIYKSADELEVKLYFLENNTFEISRFFIENGLLPLEYSICSEKCGICKSSNNEGLFSAKCPCRVCPDCLSGYMRTSGPNCPLCHTSFAAELVKTRASLQRPIKMSNGAMFCYQCLEQKRNSSLNRLFSRSSLSNGSNNNSGFGTLDLVLHKNQVPILSSPTASKSENTCSKCQESFKPDMICKFLCKCTLCYSCLEDSFSHCPCCKVLFQREDILMKSSLIDVKPCSKCKNSKNFACKCLCKSCVIRFCNYLSVCYGCDTEFSGDLFSAILKSLKFCVACKAIGKEYKGLPCGCRMCLDCDQLYKKAQCPFFCKKLPKVRHPI